ncbi:NHLP leader peptide family RiPP precursor [Paenibacillus alkaliterrae]|uniref:NHLP leader peptide family RiPP precursor n=1 Tax=Paenibacillus alkaliterrae TaxID=320909 RepID=UPI001F456E2E|nr:NHLP leader peptide family RiPP precursor [Paenibacillus alkaliterrae]MCF2939251.1 NHLP leader peptide family RiPP precursor [Paenibacillus alkaliterrae]
MTAEQTLKDQIIQKAWEDAEFKKKLLANPKAAVKEELGIDVPDTIEIEAVEETANKYYLVIPQKPAEVTIENNVEGAMWI